MATIVELELNLKKIIDESREVAQALNEFADNLERIERKYAEPEESDGGTQHDETFAPYPDCTNGYQPNLLGGTDGNGGATA